MMQLILAGNILFIREQTPEEDRFINKVTSFKPKKVNKKVFLYNKKTKQLPIGMLNMLEYELLMDDRKYEILDKRVFNRFEKVNFDYLNLPPQREYQIEAMVAALRARRGIISLPMGTGKTRVAEAIINAIKMPTVFYVDRERLHGQTVKEFRRMFRTKIGVVAGDTVDLRKITVAMIQTATSKIPEKLFTDFGVTIIDECHHVAADTYYYIAQKTKSEYIFGLSATPYREDGMEMMLHAAIGPIIYQKSLSEMIEAGYLAKIYLKILHPDPMIFFAKDHYWDVLQRGVIHNRQRNKLIAATAIEEAMIGTTYIHVDRLDHGPNIVKLINQVGKHDNRLRAKWLCGTHSTKEKDKVMNEFIGGKLRILVSTLLGEGIDVPDMYCLINAPGGGKSTKVGAPQLLGRLLRPSRHKIVVYYDIADKAKYLFKHFAKRAGYYQSLRAFILDDFLMEFDKDMVNEYEKQFRGDN